LAGSIPSALPSSRRSVARPTIQRSRSWSVPKRAARASSTGASQWLIAAALSGGRSSWHSQRAMAGSGAGSARTPGMASCCGSVAVEEDANGGQSMISRLEGWAQAQPRLRAACRLQRKSGDASAGRARRHDLRAAERGTDHRRPDRDCHVLSAVRTLPRACACRRRGCAAGAQAATADAPLPPVAWASKGPGRRALDLFDESLTDDDARAARRRDRLPRASIMFENLGSPAQGHVGGHRALASAPASPDAARIGAPVRSPWRQFDGGPSIPGRILLQLRAVSIGSAAGAEMGSTAHFFFRFFGTIAIDL
jgi:hypothetical protein